MLVNTLATYHRSRASAGILPQHRGERYLLVVGRISNVKRPLVVPHFPTIAPIKVGVAHRRVADAPQRHRRRRRTANPPERVVGVVLAPININRQLTAPGSAPQKLRLDSPPASHCKPPANRQNRPSQATGRNTAQPPSKKPFASPLPNPTFARLAKRNPLVSPSSPTPRMDLIVILPAKSRNRNPQRDKKPTSEPNGLKKQNLVQRLL